MSTVTYRKVDVDGRGSIFASCRKAKWVQMTKS
jgi:hypothetical protein